MNNQTMYELVNPEFTFKFGGKEYQIRKATLGQAIQYQQKLAELTQNKESAMDLKLIAYCIFIMLKDKEPELTEEKVLEMTPGSMDILECLQTLGFMSPQQVKVMTGMNEKIEKTLTS